MEWRGDVPRISQTVRIHACVCRPADVFTREHACMRCEKSRLGLILCHSGNLWLGSGTLSHWSILKEYFSKRILTVNPFLFMFSDTLSCLYSFYISF